MVLLQEGCSIKNNIDFVLPWVDGNEPYWRQIREKYSSTKENQTDSNSNARFRDMETLKYALRAIEKNCPWYNKIFLITKEYSPKWLNIDHPKIELVKEKDLFIDKSHLPVFSSVAIEMNLVNLQGLSEKFVYMNDDFIIWNKLNKSRFFIDNKPVDFFSHSFIPRNKLFELLRGRDTWINSINNVLNLFNQRFKPIKMEKYFLYHKSYSAKDRFNNYLFERLFKKIIWLDHWHHPQPLLKVTLQKVYNEFKEEMMKCSQNKFRSDSDLNQYMYRYWHLIHGDFYPYKYNDGFVSNLDSLQVLNKMIGQLKKNKDINFVCFNDSTKLNDTQYEQVKQRLLSFLQEKFPNKASFEI